MIERDNMSGFEIKPVKNYTPPRYPSVYADDDELERKPPSPPMILLSLMIARSRPGQR